MARTRPAASPWSVPPAPSACLPTPPRATEGPAPGTSRPPTCSTAASAPPSSSRRTGWTTSTPRSPGSPRSGSPSPDERPSMTLAPPAVPGGWGSAGSSSGVGAVDVVEVPAWAGPLEVGAGETGVAPVAVGLHPVVEPAQGREIPRGRRSAGVECQDVVEVAGPSVAGAVREHAGRVGQHRLLTLERGRRVGVGGDLLVEVEDRPDGDLRGDRPAPVGELLDGGVPELLDLDDPVPLTGGVVGVDHQLRSARGVGATACGEASEGEGGELSQQVVRGGLEVLLEGQGGRVVQRPLQRGTPVVQMTGGEIDPDV